MNYKKVLLNTTINKEINSQNITDNQIEINSQNITANQTEINSQNNIPNIKNIIANQTKIKQNEEKIQTEKFLILQKKKRKKQKQYENYKYWREVGLTHDEFCKYYNQIRKANVYCLKCFGYEIGNIIGREFRYYHDECHYCFDG
jgi:hypothetical protein